MTSCNFLDSEGKTGACFGWGAVELCVCMEMEVGERVGMMKVVKR